MMEGNEVFSAVPEKSGTAEAAFAAAAAQPAAAAPHKKAASKEDEPKDPLATGLAAWDLEPPSVVVRRRAKKL